MNERDKLIELFDIYFKELTTKQIDYFKDYYFEDLSLSEIANNYNVSKTLIAKTIKVAENKLLSLEESLKILEKKKELNKIINSINDKDLKNRLEKLLD